MNKYNVGDKFVIEVGEVFTGDFSAKDNTLYRVKGFRSLVFDKTGLDNLERLDGDYVNENFGELQNESYEVGRKVGQEEAIKWSRQNEMDMYNAGLNDAWELAKKIELNVDDGGISSDDLKKIFNIESGLSPSYWIFKDVTPQEAISKLEAYENEQEEIKVGDVVYADDEPNSFGVVTWINEKLVYVMWDDGSCGSDTRLEKLHKTGKHIDIESLLKQITE